MQPDLLTDPARIEGGFLEYFLPRGEVTVTADYTAKNGQLGMVIEPKIVADFGARRRILYTHAGLSKDVVSIQLENGMLKVVSSTTADQTLQLVQGVNAILAQVKATQAAAAAEIEAFNEDGGGGKKEPPPTPLTKPACMQDVKTIKVVDITNRREVDTAASFAECEIQIKVTPHVPDLEPIKALNARFSPKPGEAFGDPTCDQAICFRLAGAYRIDVEACLVQSKSRGGKPEPVTAVNYPKRLLEAPSVCVTKTVEFLAPTPHRLGFIRFNRRAFVENSTKATFTNGLLTAVDSTDPNELVGFLSIPSEILKGFAILITL